MKICHVINDLSRGGAESHLYSLVKLQIEKGHDVSVLLLGKDLHNFVSLENEFTSLNLNLNRFKFGFLKICRFFRLAGNPI